uniref:Glutamyl-tRNA(Gln) amidotransferase subunit A, mitochondrial n=2 Tax=Lygus hesperus TaxID=30085 RepID=A0A0A9WS96_LYGHE
MANNTLVLSSMRRASLIKELNAFISITRLQDVPPSSSKDRLNGFTVAVKDNFCTSDFKTTCASQMLSDYNPGYDASIVEKLKNEGAILFGKTNLDEFAMGSGTVDSLHGPTKNIWGSPLHYTIGGKERTSKPSWRIAGGSSGGSAVAVASGTCRIGIGSDTGGSTRNPASYCGVVGFKPTYSSVSRHGLIPLVNSMDVPGIITRTVDDAALTYNVISGQDPKDSTTVEVSPVKLDDSFNLNKIKVGIPREYHCEGLSPEVLEAWKSIARILQEAGAKVSQMSMPHTSSSIACYSVLNQCEVASNMARYDGLRYGHRSSRCKSTHDLYASSRSEGLGIVVRGRILAGNFFLLQRNYSKYFEKAMKVRRLICDDFKRAWDEFDVLLTPTTLSDAPELKQFGRLDNREQCVMNDYCTQPANMSGCPAISIPVALSKNELPLSLQLMSNNYDEETLLSVARIIEKYVSFPHLELMD